MKTYIAIIVFGIFIGLFSCQKEDTHKPASMQFTQSNNTIIYAGQTANHVGVQVLDNNAAPVGGVPVTFSITSGSAMLSSSSGITDLDGTIYTDVVFGNTSGLVILTASGGGVKATLTFRVSSSQASKIFVNSGNNQDGIAGQYAGNALKVVVTDDYGTLAPGVVVSFKVQEGDGQVTSAIAVTGGDGTASIGIQLGSNSSTNKIKASIATDSVFFYEYGSAPLVLDSLTQSKTGVTLSWAQAFTHNVIKYIITRYDGVTSTELAELDPSIFTFKDVTGVQGVTYTYKVSAYISPTFSIDSETQTIFFGLVTILDDIPTHVVIDDARQKAYVSVASKNEIEVIDVNTALVVDRLFIGSAPQRMNISHDGKTLYVALSGSGSVAFLDLDSKSISTVNVQTALGDPRAFDVIEAAPNRVFVTGNPDEYGESFIVLIKTDQNNAVERIFNEVVRFHPVMQAQYGTALYVMETNDIYLLDPTHDYSSTPGGSISSNIHFSSNKSSLALGPNGVYADNEQYSADLKTLVHTFNSGIVAIDNSGQVLTLYSSNSIQWIDTSSFQVLEQISFTADYVSEIESSQDGKTCYITYTNYQDYRLSIFSR